MTESASSESDLTVSEQAPSAPDSPGGTPAESVDPPVAEEQEHLDLLYQRLDELREERIALRDRYIRSTDGTPGGRVEREVAYARHAQAVLTLNAAEDRLCFGRLEHVDGESMHIGRMGIFAATGDQRQLLMDWRAPSARPFYIATPASPLGIRRRRHLRTRRRRVIGVADEYLDVSGLDAAVAAILPSTGTGGLAGEAALLAAIQAPRTGRMGDIVATIQAEQDRIIRADRAGIMVVQGGPGTGKTAVALHRAAYLLYTHREQLAQRGVLIIGPNSTFLRYISQVLPSLGENAVVLATVGNLFPGVSATAADEPATARIKGRTMMAGVLANAILHRQAMPSGRIEVGFEGAPGGKLQLNRELLAAAQQRAWQSRRPHNRARPLFVRHVLRALVTQVAQRMGRGPDGKSLATREDLDAIRYDLEHHEGLREALRGLWPTLSPQRLLTDLFASSERLEFAAPNLTDRDRARLTRDPGHEWTVADVPLLDEAAELLGPAQVAARSDDREARLDYADEVLDMIGASAAPEEVFSDEAPLVSMLTAEDLAALHDDVTILTSTAERAAADREWSFGHVIVDEAQELSPMAWRLVMRRCPVRSMTLVGDLAQTSDPAGATSWTRALRGYARPHLRVEELTVNYRTPAEVMDAAEPVLSRINAEARAPRSVRDAGVSPWHLQVPRADLVDRVRQLVADKVAEPGTIAVICPPALIEPLSLAVDRALGGLPTPSVDLPPVTVLSVREAKGLEFDRVLVVDPGGIIAGSQRGMNDLYVAMTRATQRLGVVHADPLPDVLHRLKDQPD